MIQLKTWKNDTTIAFHINNGKLAFETVGGIPNEKGELCCAAELCSVPNPNVILGSLVTCGRDSVRTKGKRFDTTSTINTRKFWTQSSNKTTLRKRCVVSHIRIAEKIFKRSFFLFELSFAKT